MGDKMLLMKKIITCIILCLMVSGLDAQQTYQYRYSIFDNYLLNPAYVGTKDYYPILVGHDQRFFGLNESSPQTYFLSFHSRVGQGYLFNKDGKINKFFSKFGNLALGFQFNQYQFGPERETNIGITYGYHLDLKQSYITRNPRKLILALTPRLQVMWFSAKDLKLIYSSLGDETGNETYFKDNILDGSERYSAWIFSADVAALYQTVHFDAGVSALNFIQTKNKLETKVLYLPNDTINTYDSLYPQKFLINGKLKFIKVYKSGNLDLFFVPSFAFFYAPKKNYTEYIVDLMLESNFSKTIAGIRKELIFTGQLGLNINHRREYDPKMMLLQPYISFDFKNYTITYAHSFYLDNDIVKSGAAIGGNQISLLIKLSRDRIFRENLMKEKFAN
jgi:hypothetical protein